MDTAEPKPKRKGRPGRLDQELTDRFCGFVRQGAHNTVAAAACGIPAATIKHWVHTNPIFAAAVAQARADHELSMVQAVSTQALKNATHGQWMLERRYPKRWGPRDKVHIDANVTGVDGLVAFFALAEEKKETRERDGSARLSADQREHAPQGVKRSA